MKKYLFFSYCVFLLLGIIPQITSGQIVKRSGLSLYIYLDDWQTAEKVGDTVLIKSFDGQVKKFVKGVDGVRNIYVKQNKNTMVGWILGSKLGIPGVAGHVMGYKLSVLPYARVWIINEKDTVKLTCDALGSFFWKTRRVPWKYKVCTMAEGFDMFEKEFRPGQEGRNWLSVFPPRVAKELNTVKIFADKVQFVIRGDTVEHKVDAFKTFDGDWAGDLLRKLPGVSTANGVLTVNGEPIHMVDLDNWKDFDYGRKFILDNIKREKKLQKEQRKDEKKSIIQD